MTFLLVFIVPKFEAIFHDMLGDKPLPGSRFSSLGEPLVQDNWAIRSGRWLG